MSQRLAIDFDGTMAIGAPPRILAGLREALEAFKRAGHHLILHSCRSTVTGHQPFVEDEADRFWEYGKPPEPVVFQWDLFDEMRRVMSEAGLLSLFDEVWQSPGKPLADAYIDNLAELPDWARLKRQFAI